MGSLSNYAENELLDHVCNAAHTPAATIYMGLSTADPLDDASGLSEPSGNGYVRKAITFGAAASRQIDQNADVTFDEATGSWGTLTHWGIFDAESGGNLLAHGALGTSKEVVSGNTPSVASGEVYVNVAAGEISTYLVNALLDLMFRNQAYSAPDTYVGLTTATIVDSDDGSTVTEVSGGSYARRQVNPNGGAAPTWDLAASGLVDNGGEIAFAQATAQWGTITSAFVADAATAGNVLFYDNDEITDQLVDTGDTVKFAVGDLDLQLT